ncbi:acyltransferase [Mucilaginibacter panaciglaebae]|uniref:Acyltransferase n=1 Tax=Mucilaginibacter panaciglaebae TaxID=502331 RepID=A0ABP7WND3_9SPHI
MLKAVKIVYNLLMSILAMPVALLLIIAGKLAILCRAYSEISIIASKIPLGYGVTVRYIYYKFTLKSLGSNVKFKYGTFCQYPTAVIGNRVLFGYYNAIGEVSIGDDVIVGGFVNFVSGTRQHSFEDHSQPISTQKATGRTTIHIGSDVWIGSNALIAADVGSRCVIAAGSILIRPAESRAVYGGNPAKLIKTI